MLIFNRTEIEEKLIRLAAYLGRSATFTSFLDWVLAIREALGVPHTLADLGVGDEKLEIMTAMAPRDPTAGGNPVPLDEAACRRLYENAFTGRL